jgi:hypothetical protein
MKKLSQMLRARHSRYMACFVVIALLLSVLGCGGGPMSSQNPSPQPQPNASSLLQINIGDAPADRLVAASMTIGSMTLSNSGGGTVTVVSSSTPIEIMHLMGTMQPISLMKVPQGTYSGAMVNISSATVIYIAPATGQLAQKQVPGPMTATITFSPTLNVGASPMVLNLDMNMDASVSIDNSGNVSMNPTMTASMGPGGTAGSLDPEHGGMEHMTGTVKNLSGSSFTMSMMQSSQDISVTTDSDTQFAGMGGMGGMSDDMIVMVDAIMREDGSFLAQREA